MEWIEKKVKGIVRGDRFRTVCHKARKACKCSISKEKTCRKSEPQAPSLIAFQIACLVFAIGELLVETRPVIMMDTVDNMWLSRRLTRTDPIYPSLFSPPTPSPHNLHPAYCGC